MPALPTLRAAALAALAALLAAAPAAAQSWAGVGAPVCTAAGAQTQVRSAGDGAGGAFIGWSDQRPGAAGSDVYLQHLGADGVPAPGWPADGWLVCGATGAQLLYAMAADGTGGVFLAWEDNRGGSLSDVYGAHVLADGSSAAGWPADGLAISDFMEEQRGPQLVADGAGGVFCVWADARTYAFSARDVYAQHLHGDGTPASGWADDGMRVTDARTYDYQPQAASDGGGGLYVTWTRGLAGQDIGAQHLGADGLPYGAWPDSGLVLCGAAGDQSGPGMVPAPGGTAIAIWKDLRNYTAVDTETDFYALRIGPDTAAVALWPREGLQLYASTAGISAPFAVGDGAGGLLFGWGELVSASDENLFVMHADSLGIVVTSISAPDGIVPVCPHPAYQHPVAFVPDGAGGVYVGFDDYRDAGPSFTNPDPYVQHVTAGAAIAPGWPATGVALTQATTMETGTLPVAVTGGVIVAFTRGTGSDADLFASYVGLDGIVPALASLVSGEATPGRVRLAWAVSGDASAAWRIERRGEASAWAEVASAFADGTGRVAYDDTDVVPGARYGYRLAPAAGGAPLAEAWVTVPRTETAFALRGVAPNPVAGEARVRFALPAAGEARLALLDLQGRVRAEWPVRGEGGEQERAFAAPDGLRAGVYWLRLSQGGRQATVRLALLR